LKVKESVTDVVRAGDEICTDLEVLEVLPPEDMAGLLRKELESRGFESRDDGTLSRADGPVTVTVDPCTGRVTVTATAEERVTREAEVTGQYYDDAGPGEARTRDGLQEKARQQAAKQIDERRSELQGVATDALEGALERLRPELSDAVNRVTREALKEKAKQMGTVKDVSENESSGELTIRIEV
jgi:hypothetical protein